MCKQLHQGLSLKNSFQTLLYAFQKNSTLFSINNMSFTYTYQKCCSAPTHFLVNTGFTASLYNTLCFDNTFKAYIPTLRGLHQSINGSSRGRRTLIVVLLSTKLDLSKKVFDKVQGVDYDEIFSLISMLKVCPNHVSNCRIL